MKLGHQGAALARLMPLVYAELRRLAGHWLQGEHTGHTLQPNRLVHKAFLQLVNQDTPAGNIAGSPCGRGTTDAPRPGGLRPAARRRQTRGIAVTLDEERFSAGADVDRAGEILAVEEGLGRLARLDRQQAQVVELRYFGGIRLRKQPGSWRSPARSQARWAMAKAWLRPNWQTKDRR